MTLIVFAILAYFTSYHVNQETVKKLKIDSVQYSVEFPSLHFDLEDTKSKQELSLRPVTNSKAGFALRTGDFGLGIGFEDPSQNEDTKKFGRTRAFDFQINSLMGNKIFELYYQTYNGYSAENEKTSVKSKIDYGYRAENYGVQLTTFLNPNYHAAHSLMQFNYKREANSSWYWNIDFSKTIFAHDDEITPIAYRDDFTYFKGLKQISATGAAAVFGHASQYLFKENYYFQYMLGVGANYKRIETLGGNIPTQYMLNAQKTNLLVNFGKQFQQSLLGLQIYANSSVLTNSDNYLFRTNRINGQVYYHYFF
jgi:hypothetical protein